VDVRKRFLLSGLQTMGRDRLVPGSSVPEHLLAGTGRQRDGGRAAGILARQ
jgi:hypothetical protein